MNDEFLVKKEITDILNIKDRLAKVGEAIGIGLIDIQLTVRLPIVLFFVFELLCRNVGVDPIKIMEGNVTDILLNSLMEKFEKIFPEGLQN